MSCKLPRVSTTWQRPNCEGAISQKCRNHSAFAGRKMCGPEENRNWVDFPLNVTTIPVDTNTVELPTNASTKARYIVDGKKMTVQYFFQNQGVVEGGNIGSGEYFVPLPVGFTYDNTTYIVGQAQLSIPEEQYYTTVTNTNFFGADYLRIETLNGIVVGPAPNQVLFGDVGTPITTSSMHWSIIADLAIV